MIFYLLYINKRIYYKKYIKLDYKIKFKFGLINIHDIDKK